MSKKKSSLTKFYRRWSTRRGTQSHSSCSEPSFFPASERFSFLPDGSGATHPSGRLPCRHHKHRSGPRATNGPPVRRPGDKGLRPEGLRPEALGPEGLGPARPPEDDHARPPNHPELARHSQHTQRKTVHCGQVVGRATRRPNLPCRDLQQ